MEPIPQAPPQDDLPPPEPSKYWGVTPLHRVAKRRRRWKVHIYLPQDLAKKARDGDERFQGLVPWSGMQYLYRQFGDEDKAAEFYDEVVRAYNLDMPLNDPKTPAEKKRTEEAGLPGSVSQGLMAHRRYQPLPADGVTHGAMASPAGAGGEKRKYDQR